MKSEITKNNQSHVVGRGVPLGSEVFFFQSNCLSLFRLKMSRQKRKPQLPFPFLHKRFPGTKRHLGQKIRIFLTKHKCFKKNRSSQRQVVMEVKEFTLSVDMIIWRRCSLKGANIIASRKISGI